MSSTDVTAWILSLMARSSTARIDLRIVDAATERSLVVDERAGMGSAEIDTKTALPVCEAGMGGVRRLRPLTVMAKTEYGTSGPRFRERVTRVQMRAQRASLVEIQLPSSGVLVVPSEASVAAFFKRCNDSSEKKSIAEPVVFEVSEIYSLLVVACVADFSGGRSLYSG